MTALVVAALAVASVYLALVGGLLLAGRRAQARALAGFVPDCAVLMGRLARDERLPRRQKVAIALVAGYLASPLDLVPDFIPVVGQLDDALLVSLLLRVIVRGAGATAVREHWPGPEDSLRLVLRLAGAGAAG